MIIQRRAFLTGLVASFAAPAVCKAEWLMPVKKLVVPIIIRMSPDRYIKDGVGYMVEDGVWVPVADLAKVGTWKIGNVAPSETFHGHVGHMQPWQPTPEEARYLPVNNHH